MVEGTWVQSTEGAFRDVFSIGGPARQTNNTMLASPGFAGPPESQAEATVTAFGGAEVWRPERVTTVLDEVTAKLPWVAHHGSRPKVIQAMVRAGKRQRVSGPVPGWGKSSVTVRRSSGGLFSDASCPETGKQPLS